MPEIPEEALHAAASAIELVSRAATTVTDGEMVRARAAVEASAPIVAEHIAQRLAAMVDNYPPDIFPPDGTSTDAIAAKAMLHAYTLAARIAREMYPPTREQQP